MRRAMNKKKRTLQKASSVIMIVLFIGTIVMAMPFLWMILTAFKTISETTSVNPFVIFPKQ
jgi:multiple sugar transport system permease protein